MEVKMSDKQSQKPRQRIIFIEDDEMLVRAYQNKLTMEDFEVAIALDGEDALKQLQEKKFDLILLDLMLPKVDGFTILEKLRTSNWFSKNKPVVVFSNLGQESDINRAKDLGANDYLVKANLTPNQVVEKIREHLK